MAMTSTPVFPQTPKNSWCIATTANNVYDGTGTIGTNIWTAFTAGSNGSRLDKIVLKPLGTNVATVMRVFLNNGSTNATATNNALFSEQTLSATAASATSSLGEVVLDYTGTDTYIQSGYKLNVNLGTTVAAGWQVTVFAGDY